MPLVSVIIPTYNQQRYLEKALLSVFAQTYKDYELIVVDDGSTTSATENVCKRYKDRLVYLRQNNSGQARARNLGISQSHGEYLAFLDDDDIWLPEKIQKQVSCFTQLNAKNINAGLVYTGHQYITEDDSVINNILYKSSGNNYAKMIFIDFIGTPSSVMVPRSVINDVGLFDENLNNTEDYDLWLRIGKKYDIYSINEFLTKYRKRANSVSKNVALKVFNVDKVLEKILRDDLLMDSATRIKLAKQYKKNAAIRYKNAAYNYLFQKSDAKKFREFIKKGYSVEKSLFDFKVLIFYLFSFFSSDLCKYLRDLKKENDKDIIIDVNNLKF